jgi:hypothetical protein
VFAVPGSEANSPEGFQPQRTDATAMLLQGARCFEDTGKNRIRLFPSEIYVPLIPDPRHSILKVQQHPDAHHKCRPVGRLRHFKFNFPETRAAAIASAWVYCIR